MEKPAKSIPKQNASVKYVPDIQPEQFDFVGQNLQKIQGFNEDLMEKIEQAMIQTDDINFGLGAMFGAFMGDSLGSYCEFRKQTIKEGDPELDFIMQMPGKGTWKIKPGQFTDDSEPASHLLEGLLSAYDSKQPFESQQQRILLKIAQQYVKWFKSEPFDIGNTTRKAFKILRRQLYELKIDIQQKQEQGVPNKQIEQDENKRLHTILTEIRKVNENSISNGSLMRITPMAFFISLLLQRIEYEELTVKHFENFIKGQSLNNSGEINMTHGNEEVFQSSFVWVELLVDLILRKKNNRSLKEIYDNFIEKYRNDSALKEWIEDSVKNYCLDAAQEQGWARVAFTYGIKALQRLSDIDEEDMRQKNYESLIRQVVSRVGDSDTNACIVGGIIGAVLGFKRLPVKYLRKQFELELDEDDRQCSNRGSFYEPKLQFFKAFKLIEKLEKL